MITLKKKLKQIYIKIFYQAWMKLKNEFIEETVPWEKYSTLRWNLLSSII